MQLNMRLRILYGSLIAIQRQHLKSWTSEKISILKMRVKFLPSFQHRDPSRAATEQYVGDVRKTHPAVEVSERT